MKFPSAARKAATAAAPLAVAVVLAGCGEDAAQPPASGSLTLQFRHQVDAVDLVFGPKIYLNAAGNLYGVRDLKYYVSDVALRASDGSLLPLGDVHYVDAASAPTRSWSLGSVPNGRYDELRFTFGLAPERNVFGTLPPTQENLNMNWPATLGGGYHFMQLDGNYVAGHDDNAGWQSHMGRLQRPTDPEPYDPHFEVRLPLDLAVAGESWNAELVMNVNGWFAAPHVYDFDVFGNYVMENPTAQIHLMDNGPQALALGAVAPAGP